MVKRYAALLGAFLFQSLFVFGAHAQYSTSPVPFTDDYIAENRGNRTYDVPETFELANVVLAIAALDGNSPLRPNEDLSYYNEVVAHFSEFSEHELFRQLRFDENPYRSLSLRENSPHWKFSGDRLIKADPYPHHWYKLPELAGVLGETPDTFGELKSHIEGFADKSDFREFFNQHKEYYDQQISEFKDLAPIDDMILWLTREFGSFKYDSYRVIFSPLVGGTHSAHWASGNGFSEAMMYVPMPDYVKESSSGETVDPKFYAPRLARLLFTEIDHPFVNPITDRHADRVNDVFGDFTKWNKQNSAGSYANAYDTFNEYMTWAVFVLWAYDVYDLEIAEYARAYSERTMANRQFSKFPEFTTALLEIYRNRKDGETVQGLYPKILEWAEAQ